VRYIQGLFVVLVALALGVDLYIREAKTGSPRMRKGMTRGQSPLNATIAR
jgi:hypothetical protein